MTPEELRIEIIKWIDDGLGRWIVPEAAKKILRAERKLWMLPDAPLDKLLTFYEEE